MIPQPRLAEDGQDRAAAQTLHTVLDHCGRMFDEPGLRGCGVAQRMGGRQRQLGQRLAERQPLQFGLDHLLQRFVDGVELFLVQSPQRLALGRSLRTIRLEFVQPLAESAFVIGSVDPFLQLQVPVWSQPADDPHGAEGAADRLLDAGLVAPRDAAELGVDPQSRQSLRPALSGKTAAKLRRENGHLDARLQVLPRLLGRLFDLRIEALGKRGCRRRGLDGGCGRSRSRRRSPRPKPLRSRLSPRDRRPQHCYGNGQSPERRGAT